MLGLQWGLARDHPSLEQIFAALFLSLKVCLSCGQGVTLRCGLLSREREVGIPVVILVLSEGYLVGSHVELGAGWWSAMTGITPCIHEGGDAVVFASSCLLWCALLGPGLLLSRRKGLAAGADWSLQFDMANRRSLLPGDLESNRENFNVF